jgi:hypothetical protein
LVEEKKSNAVLPAAIVISPAAPIAQIKNLPALADSKPVVMV